MSNIESETKINPEFLNLFAQDILKNSSDSSNSELRSSSDEFKKSDGCWDDFKNINITIDNTEVKLLKKIINYMININQ